MISARLEVGRMARVVGTAAVGLLMLGWVTSSSYLQNNVTTATGYALAALSITVITGWTGQISLAQLSLMAFSAFVFGLLAGADPFRSPTLPWAAAVPIAIVATVALGVLLSLPALRIRGLHFAVISLAIAYTVDIVVFTEGSIVPRSLQNLLVRRPTALAALRPFSVFCLIVLAVVVLLLRNLRRSAFGRAMMAVRDAEVAASVLGIDVVRCKMYSFAISSGIAAVGGVIFLWKIGGVSTTALSLGIDRSMFVLGLTVIAGTRSLAGGVLAGVFAVFLPEYAQRIFDKESYALLAAGIGVSVLPIVLPDGVVTLPRRVADLLVGRRRPARLEDGAAGPEPIDLSGSSPRAADAQQEEERYVTS